MKERFATILSWLAFINAPMVVNFPIFIVVCSKCDMFESKSLYYHVTQGYFDFLAMLPGEGLWLFFNGSQLTERNIHLLLNLADHLTRR